MIKNNLEIITTTQREMKTLQNACNTVEWDMRTGMPRDAAPGKGEQMSLLQRLIFERETDSKYENAIIHLSNEKLPPRETRMVSLLNERLSRQKKLSGALVEKISLATNAAQRKRTEAQEANDYKILSPALGDVIHLLREKADLIGEKGHAYNSLLVDYEKGMTVEKIDPIFGELKNELLKLLQKIENSDVYSKQTDIVVPLEPVKLAPLIKDVVQRIGLTKNNSRIDTAEHPFTTSLGQNDVRITTAYDRTPYFGFRAAIHEAGHALYELNLPTEERHTILGEAPSFGIHESQSRFWECMVAQSHAFWKGYYPKFNETFNLKMNEQEWYAYVNRVHPGTVRMVSDEVHYGLHIILRYEIEKGIFDGKYEAKELGEIWNEKMREYFGVVPENDKVGILQDGHWATGSFGYFPTYTIGNIYAGQINEKIRKDVPLLNENIQKGEFSIIGEWLKTHIHQKGFTKDADEIIRDACGSGLDAKPYVDYLNEKYSQLYQL